ncbi:MAG: hypothetical protein ISP58_08390 [Flavobacteriales bacterium]|nr:hypothetical protein [Flavobacteriales bacterium]
MLQFPDSFDVPDPSTIVLFPLLPGVPVVGSLIVQSLSLVVHPFGKVPILADVDSKSSERI